MTNTDSTDNAPDDLLKRLRKFDWVWDELDIVDQAADRIELLETRTKEAVETLRKGFKSCDPTKTAAAIILAIAQLEGHGE